MAWIPSTATYSNVLVALNNFSSAEDAGTTLKRPSIDITNALRTTALATPTSMAARPVSLALSPATPTGSGRSPKLNPISPHASGFVESFQAMPFPRFRTGSKIMRRSPSTLPTLSMPCNPLWRLDWTARAAQRRSLDLESGPPPPTPGSLVNPLSRPCLQ